MVQIISDKEVIRALCEVKRNNGCRIGCVPTMGALHEGHLSLVRLAVEKTDFVVVTVFVNPAQFGPGEDLDRYPRDMKRDIELLEPLGAHIVFAPEPAAMYPEGYATWVHVERLTDRLCGASRPGHFRGVATIVAKLFNLIRPHLAVFGQKDAQQAAVIRRMVRDLDMGVKIEVAPIVREPDGLAMSSRNRYLSPGERREATVLHRALVEAEALARSGETSSSVLRERVRSVIAASPLAEIEYIEIVDPDEITPLDDVTHGALVAVAARFGNTRLIDNTLIPPMV
jgi:pantoate--beta-alanine ligase